MKAYHLNIKTIGSLKLINKASGLMKKQKENINDFFCQYRIY